MGEHIQTVNWSQAPEGVYGFTSKRFGGVSKGKYEGLNLGVNTRDETANVFKNYKLLQSRYRLNNIVILNQVHRADVLEVTSENYTEVYLSNGDGLFTLESDIALGIQTADCFPVLLAGKKGIAALHCGWRSLNAGIIENAIKLFEKYNDFPDHAFLGPGICGCCYEIKDDMVKMLNKKYQPETALTALGNGSYKFDLRKEAQNAFTFNKIRFIEECKLTCCHSNGFYSYRRDGGDTGRMISVVARGFYVCNG